MIKSLRPRRIFLRPADSYPALPEKLYRFRSFSRKRHIKEELAAAKTGSIRFSDPSSFNDPYDCTTAINPNPSTDPLQSIREYMSRGFCTESDHKRYEELQQRVRSGATVEAINIYIAEMAESLTSRIACACFVEEWQDIAMWNHYANGHSGACLEFTRDEDLRDPLFAGQTMSRASLHLNKVSYQKRPFLYRLEDLLELYFTGDGSDISSDKVSFFDFINRSFFWKSEHWESEKEWRALLNYRKDLSDGNSYSEFPGYRLTKVVIGPRANEAEVSTIRKLCAANEVPAFRTLLSKTRYGLSLYPAELTTTEIFRAETEGRSNATE